VSHLCQTVGVRLGSVNKLLPVLGLTALTACGAGLVPLPPISVPDINLSLPAADASVPYVLYSTQNSLGDAPDLAQYLASVNVSGNVSYSTSGGTLSAATVYVRTTLDGCTLTGTFALCDASGESANSIGNVTIVAGKTTPLKLSGSALTKAAQQRRAFFGVKIKTGSTMNGDALNVTSVKVNARL